MTNNSASQEVVVTPAYRVPFAGSFPIKAGPGCPPEHVGASAEAIDYAMKRVEVLATEEGKVLFADDIVPPTTGQTFPCGNKKCKPSDARQALRFGIVVLVEHPDHTVSYYAHLSEKKVVAGDVVERGKIVGISGNSGLEAGKNFHLHFERRSGPFQIWSDGYRGKGSPVSVRDLPTTSLSEDPSSLGCFRGSATLVGP